MSLLPLPAPDAPASEWGRLAVSIPGWHWPKTDSAWYPPGFVKTDGYASWVYEGGLCKRDLYAACPADLAMHLIHDCAVCPDPDHWAWEGWLRRMLGDPLTRVFWYGINVTVRVNIMPPKGERVFIAEHGERGFNQPTIGRACIAAAAALGRWPGGEG